jgi:TetR/AcrR family transcriptional regulator
MPKVHEKQLLKRKQETLDTVARLLTERGYANLNMDELAEEVGISKPTLYQYFNSKEELIAQATVRTFEKLEAQISEQSEKSPLDQLEHFLRFTLKARHENRNAVGQVDQELMRSILQRHPHVIDHLRTMKARLGQVVKKAQQQGQIDPSLPAWVVVNSMFALQRAVSNPFQKDELPRSESEVAEGIDAIVRMFKRGITPPA